MADTTTTTTNNDETNQQQSNVHSNEDLSKMFLNENMDKLVRGDTLENVEQRCLELCQAYIAGSWLNASSVDDIEVCRITGGLTNQLYRVKLRDTVPRVPNNANEPYDVAIKMYLDKHISSDVQNEDERLNDVIVCTILSRTQISPTVYGIYKNGMIMDFIPHERFRAKHHQNQTLIRKLAHLLARVHHLNVPIRKEKDWLFESFSQSLNFAYENCQLKELSIELNLFTLKSFDFKQEYEKMRQLVVSRTTNLVFCHNDFRGSNILISGDDDENIHLVDLEYASYGNRGIDIASLIADLNNENGLDLKNSKPPSDDIIEMFAKFYLEGCDQVKPGYSQQLPENSLDNLIKDIKICYLINCLLLCIFLAKQTKSFMLNVPFDRKANYQLIDNVLDIYINLKQLYIHQGIEELKTI